MTPQEKAKQLVDRYYFSLPNNGSFSGINNINSRWDEGKQCALIAVDEILNVVERVYYHDANMLVPYWEEVKQEIEKIG
jgi:hypothetical protein